YKFLVKPLNKILEERQKKIEEGYKNKEEAERLIKEVKALREEILAKTEKEKELILNSAYQQKEILINQFLEEIDKLRKDFSQKFEKEKEEKLKKLQIIEKEREIELTYTIESLKNKLLDLQRQKRELEREYEALKKRYEESSILDILTEVYREEYFLRRLKEEMLRAKRYGRVFSLLYIVIDKLGELGKKFGIGEEEKFLKNLASSFKSFLRRVDLVCKAKKWDTFYVILPETPSQGAMVVARKLLRKIEELYFKEYNLKYSAYITVLTFDPKKYGS
ncbi:MAG: diguanylate cyclase domain-containing protein, partial [Caldimicrobium sp.]